MFSFETPGDYVQRIEFSDAENYLLRNNQIRREYPLVLVVHSLIDDNSTDFFQLVRFPNKKLSPDSYYYSLANSNRNITCEIIDTQRPFYQTISVNL